MRAAAGGGSRDPRSASSARHDSMVSTPAATTSRAARPDQHRPEPAEGAGDPLPLGDHRRQARTDGRDQKGQPDHLAHRDAPPGHHERAAYPPAGLGCAGRPGPRAGKAAGEDPLVRHLRRCGAPPGAVLRRRAARARREVQECNAPLGPRHRGPGLDAAPAVAAAAAGLAAGRLLGAWRGAAGARRRHRPDAVVVGYLGHFDVLLARRLFPHVPVVLDHLIGARHRARPRCLRRAPAAAAALAGPAALGAPTWSSSTPRSTGLCPLDRRDRAVVVPVGAPPAW